jgi:hypothetical protein
MIVLPGNNKRRNESGREDLNLRPYGPEPYALTRLRYAPKSRLIYMFNISQRHKEQKNTLQVTGFKLHGTNLKQITCKNL